MIDKYEDLKKYLVKTISSIQMEIEDIQKSIEIEKLNLAEFFEKSNNAKVNPDIEILRAKSILKFKWWDLFSWILLFIEGSLGVAILRSVAFPDNNTFHWFLCFAISAIIVTLTFTLKKISTKPRKINYLYNLLFVVVFILFLISVVFLRESGELSFENLQQSIKSSSGSFMSDFFAGSSQFNFLMLFTVVFGSIAMGFLARHPQDEKEAKKIMNMASSSIKKKKSELGLKDLKDTLKSRLDSLESYSEESLNRKIKKEVLDGANSFWAKFLHSKPYRVQYIQNIDKS